MHQPISVQTAARKGNKMVKICVIGAGINGLTCALKIKEKYRDFNVTIISDDFTPNTTGDGSGGLWYPYLCGNTSQENLTRWGIETYHFLHDLWYSGNKYVSLMPMYELYRKKRELSRPLWADFVFGYRDMDKKQLDNLSRMHSIEYAYAGFLTMFSFTVEHVVNQHLKYYSHMQVFLYGGRTFNTFVIQAPKILEYLFKRYEKAGGKVVKAKIDSLTDPILQRYHIVVNCTGLRARELVPDQKVFPIRGQIARVKAPWVKYTVVDEDSGHYIIPNDAYCVLGGTHQENDYRTDIDEKDKEFILNGCYQMIPSLKSAEIIKHWAGLRPGRDEVRLEAEKRDGKIYIHNYGHGGSGLTLFWGCGDNVIQLLEQNLESIKPTDIKSKL